MSGGVVGSGEADPSERSVVGVLRKDGVVVGEGWQPKSANFRDILMSLEDTGVGALALRGIVLIFEEGERKGGTESRRGFTGLRIDGFEGGRP